MNGLQSIVEAIESLSSNKLRSALTILGIVIGVAAVIAMLALGRGVQDSVNSEFSGIGTMQLMVYSDFQPEVRNPKALTLEDAAALSDPLIAPDVAQVAAQVGSQVQVSYGSKSVFASMAGVTDNYAEVQNLEVQEGEFIRLEQNQAQSSVVVLGPKLADKLFGRSEGITGEMVRLSGQPFRVIGVLKSKGSSGMSMNSTDDQALVPISTAQARLGQRSPRTQVDMITVQVRDVAGIEAATEQISQILRTRHRTTIGADDFGVLAAQSLLDSVNQVTGTLTIFLGGVAAISLLVGGIGIMNIMLVSVTERTREIGLRKALGATRANIRVQFLIESGMLSLTGGVIGIILSWLITLAVAAAAAASGANLNPRIGLDAIVLATLFSTAIGVFFGFYPSNRAAALEPVEALRYE